ncbi:hypothetical protein K1719_039426 [Acacia pycnantha]|nr:hypothetical protein K1719_039426 [Acacia pycnantha]
MPRKCKDPWTFSIPCLIGNYRFDDCMLDLGKSILSSRIDVIDDAVDDVLNDSILILEFELHPDPNVHPDSDFDELNSILMNSNSMLTLSRIDTNSSACASLNMVSCIPKGDDIELLQQPPKLLLHRATAQTRVEIPSAPSKYAFRRRLNQATRKDHYPLPFIDQMLERLAGEDDLHMPLWDICLPEDAFWPLQCTWHFSPLYGEYFLEFLEDCMEVFMDDFTVYGSDFDACLANLSRVLHRCIESNLVLNYEKCHFMVESGIVLGHIVSRKGIEVDPAKIDVIIVLPYPASCGKFALFLVMQFLSTFHSRFQQDSPTLVQPSHKDTDFVFDDACKAAFDHLKRCPTTTPLIQPPIGSSL